MGWYEALLANQSATHEHSGRWRLLLGLEKEDAFVNIQEITEVAATVGAGAATLSLANALGEHMPQLTPLIVPAVSAIVGMVAGYAVLRSAVERIQSDIKEMRSDMRAVLEKVNEKAVAIARLEERIPPVHHEKY